jgi:predicted transposase/invertase (TIGR01784 family)
MPERLQLTLDYTFKKTFTEKHEILIDLINSVLEFPSTSKIECIEIRNPGILPEDIHKKYIILDIIAYDNLDRQYNIEMQAAKFDAYPDRAAYYLSGLFGSQLDRGEDYSLIAPALGLHFLNYIQYPDYPDDFHFDFSLRDGKYHDIVLSENFSLHLLELSKVTEKIYARNNKTEWLYFLKNAHKEKEENMQKKYANPMIHEAFHLLNELSANDEARLQARARERAIFNKRIELGYARQKGLEEGIEKGIEKGTLSTQIAIGTKLKQLGMTDDQIAQATSLDASTIQALEV